MLKVGKEQMTTDYSYHANKFEFCSLMSFLVTFNCFLYEIIVESQAVARNNAVSSDGKLLQNLSEV